MVLMAKDTLFIQFYTHWKNHGINSLFYDGDKYIDLDNKNFQISTILSNGFSSCYSKCKDKGDFFWVRYDLYNTIDKIIEKNKNLDLPINKGKVYISAYFNVHLYQAYLWAKKYPNISFIVGGPAADFKKIYKKLPNNLTITLESIDKLFGEKGGNWGVDFPEDVSQEVLWGFPVDRNCYWGKCIFCNYGTREQNIDVKFDFIDSIPKRKKNIAFLYTPSASPEFVEQVLPKIKTREDLEISFFIRGSNDMYQALLKTFDTFKLTNLALAPGIDFPSNRMLKWLNKGTTTDSILKTLELIHSNNCRIYSQVLLGFNNLKAKDVNDAEKFFKRFYNNTEGKAKIKIHNLVCKINTPIYDLFVPDKPFQLGPFYFGFLPKISKEQTKLNNMVRDLIYESKFFQINDLYSNHNIKNYEFC